MVISCLETARHTQKNFFYGSCSQEWKFAKFIYIRIKSESSAWRQRREIWGERHLRPYNISCLLIGASLSLFLPPHHEKSLENIFKKNFCYILLYMKHAHICCLVNIKTDDETLFLCHRIIIVPKKNITVISNKNIRNICDFYPVQIPLLMQLIPTIKIHKRDINDHDFFFLI